MNNFLSNFLKISTLPTLISVLVLVISIYIMALTKKKNMNFSNRMLVALFLGLAIGLGIDLLYGNSDVFNNISRDEISIWYYLVGGTFVRLIQMMAVPVVFLSVFFVILEFEGKNIKGFTLKTLAMLLGTTAIAAIVAIILVNVTGLVNQPFAGDISESMSERITGISDSSFPQYFGNIVPSNIVQAFTNNGGVISVALIAVLFSISAKFLKSKGKTEVNPVIDFLSGLQKLVNSVLINIIKIMPYAIIALVANTIISNGIDSILALIGFIAVLYLSIVAMLLIYMVILSLVGLNPVQFYKKSFPTMIFAFSSRSSVGTLPHTLDTMINRLGISKRTANFIGPLSTTVGMNGCAGVFPAMLGVLVAAAAGVELNLSFYFLLVLVVTLGSIGIAGVPGTATVAATVTLNGIGLGQYFSSVGSVFGIDPIIDMGRTMLNVTGAMVSALVVDKWEGSHSKEKYDAKISDPEEM